ncbi:hypothetical protein [Pontibacillus yanchengensis]|uniref:hypothetical protein n=1 Tax=Pontibacillus yanchengensis TaxID=462910 RepID=UPI0019286AA5|nr:hypothetical protein [Pontibacillus yanchengensis]
MSVLKSLFIEACPTCEKTLVSNKSDFATAKVVKSCPNNHYEKEYHPSLEGYVVTKK